MKIIHKMSEKNKDCNIQNVSFTCTETTVVQCGLKSPKIDHHKLSQVGKYVTKFRSRVESK